MPEKGSSDNSGTDSRTDSRAGNAQTTDRRGLLKRAGQVGALAALPTGAATAGAAGEATGPDTMPDTTFDPTDRDSVLEFVGATFEASRAVERRAVAQAGARESVDLGRVMARKRAELLDRLDDRQVRAVGEVLDDAELVVDTEITADPGGVAGEAALADAVATDDDTATTSSVGTLSYEFERFSKTVTAAIKVPGLGTYDAFDFTHTIEWEYDEAAERCRNIEPSAGGNGRKYYLVYWEYKGASRDDVTTRFDAEYFLSEKTGTFDGCILVSTGFSCTRTDMAYTELYGTSNGTAGLVEKEIY